MFRRSSSETQRLRRQRDWCRSSFDLRGMLEAGHVAIEATSGLSSASVPEPDTARRQLRAGQWLPYSTTFAGHEKSAPAVFRGRAPWPTFTREVPSPCPGHHHIVGFIPLLVRCLAEDRMYI